MNTKLTTGLCVALALGNAPTALLDRLAHYDQILGARSRPSNPTVLPRDELQLLRIPLSVTELAIERPDPGVSQQASRDTTPREHAIGELRRWAQLSANWDGEGAAAPNLQSLREASNFACLRPDDAGIEPMLHASGRAGLYWNEPGLYADLEFFGDRSIAYYIERDENKHKGVIKNFNSTEMPAVLDALLSA